jgi:heme exporter protein B
MRFALLSLRKPSLILNPLLFFLLVITLFPLGLSPSTQILHQIAPGLIWVAALLSALLGKERLFQADYEAGVLEQTVLQSMSLSLYAFVKIIVFWLFSLFPLLLLSPLLGVMLHLSFSETGVLMLSLLLGTPVVNVMVSIIAALTVGVGEDNALMSLLLLPLTIPILIFGAGSVLMVMQGASAFPLLLLLSALCLVSVSLGPFAVAFALRLIDY